tara:strand:- start:17 stop:2824 length:2808 start_codon:yes stop_codon:yes gene_type:complete
MIQTLARILANEGYYCLVAIKKSLPVQHSFYTTLEELQVRAEKRLASGWDIYYGCFTYKDGSSRKVPNALLAKSFWLDLDCGEGDNKPFNNQSEALAALKVFCNTTGLPTPTLINSGNGIHVYWILQDAVTVDLWEPVAERLKQLCVEHKFEADPVVTADVARILRIPDTLNFKTDPPKEVKVIHEQDEVDYLSFDTFKSFLGEIEVKVKEEPFVLAPLHKNQFDKQQSRFETIVKKVIAGTGCAQIGNALLNQNDIVEPLWRAAVSIAVNCVDSDKAIHVISNKHSGYTPEETIKKANGLGDKPYRCSTFESIAPEHCVDCPNKGKIGSPIVLGREIIQAEEVEEITEDETAEDGKFTPPKLPDPYFCSSRGGIYKKTKDVDELDIEIYKNNLFVIKRLKDKERGELVFVRLELPKDPPDTFMIPYSVMSSKEELRKLLSQKGILLKPKKLDLMMSYLIDCAEHKQYEVEAEIMRTQFGWADNDTKFILGDKEIGANTIKFSPPSSVTERLCPYFEPKGKLEEWKKVVSVYNMPNCEPHAFGFFTAFGAPLIKHLGYNGAMINLINSHSGTGKSTILKVCNSVYGHPDKLLAQETDTFAHKMNRLGIMNTLPYTIDEITNMPPEAVSTLVYGVAQGMGPGRMQSQNNMERKNDTTWSLIALASSNSSMAEKLNYMKQFADGEIMRLLEYRIDSTSNLSKKEASRLFETVLLQNYAVAGPAYIQYVVQNLPVVIDLVKEIQEDLDRRAVLVAKERFWSAVIACNIAGATVAKSMGLIDIDVDRVKDWAVAELVPTLRQQISEPDIDYVGIIGAFLNFIGLNNILILNSTTDKRTGLYELPINEPKNEMNVRYEVDINTLYVFTKTLRSYCVKEQIMVKELLRNLKMQGVYIGVERKRMGKGTALNSPSVDTHVFKLNESIVDVDELVNNIGDSND